MKTKMFEKLFLKVCALCALCENNDSCCVYCIFGMIFEYSETEIIAPEYEFQFLTFIFIEFRNFFCTFADYDRPDNNK